MTYPVESCCSLVDIRRGRKSLYRGRSGHSTRRQVDCLGQKEGMFNRTPHSYIIQIHHGHPWVTILIERFDQALMHRSRGQSVHIPKLKSLLLQVRKPRVT